MEITVATVVLVIPINYLVLWCESCHNKQRFIRNCSDRGFAIYSYLHYNLFFPVRVSALGSIILNALLSSKYRSVKKRLIVAFSKCTKVPTFRQRTITLSKDLNCLLAMSKC